MLGVDGVACAEVSSHAPRSVWCVEPIDAGEGGEEQAHAQGDRGRRDEDTQRASRPLPKRQAQPEADHRETTFGEL